MVNKIKIRPAVVVLFGRGQFSQNVDVKFREFISTHKPRYDKARRGSKANVVEDVLLKWQAKNLQGRVLRKGELGKWFEVSDNDEEIWTKTMQLLWRGSRSAGGGDDEESAPKRSWTGLLWIENIIQNIWVGVVAVIEAAIGTVIGSPVFFQEDGHDHLRIDSCGVSHRQSQWISPSTLG